LGRFPKSSRKSICTLQSVKYVHTYQMNHQFKMKPKSKTSPAVAISLLLYGAMTCSHPQGMETISKDEKYLSGRIAKLAPAGWTLYDKVQRFTAENLYEQIDGRAEYYLSYDVIDLLYASYEKKGAPESFLDLSIYDMGTPTGAFGVFSGEYTPGALPMDLGRAAYRSDANYYIWKGQYYIQIIASDATQEFQRTGLKLSRQITDLLVDSGDPVWGLKALPPVGLIQNSVRYFKVDALGLDFLRNTYTAQYEKGGGTVSVFLSQCETPESSRSTVVQYTDYARQYGDAVEHATEGGIEMVVCDMGEYYDIVFQKGCLAGGVTSEPDRLEAIQAAVDFWRELDGG